MTDPLKKGLIWQWEKPAATAFAACKQAISDAPVLPSFDPALPTQIAVDASEFAIGAVLQQETPSGLKPVAFESRKLTPAERNYPVHEKENLAMVHALKLWRHYLIGRHFTILTDNHALKFLQTQPHLSGPQARWLQLVEQYDFTIKHVPGTTNVVADALSRRPDLRSNLLLCAPRSESSLTKSVLHHRSDDSDYMHTLEQVKTAAAPFTFSTNEDDLLFYQSPDGGPARLYIPTSMRDSVIQEAHDINISGHLGMDKTLERVMRRFYWPSIEATVRAYVRAYVSTCEACQRNKPSNRRPAGLLQPLPIPDKRWDSVSINFMINLPKTKSGFDAILVFVDRLSKRIHIVPTHTNVTAPQTARLFFDHVFRHHGLPLEIVSDRDSLFTSIFWESLFKLTGTTLSMSTPMHPQTDGQTERANRVIEEMLRAYISFQLDDWDEHLTAIEFAYNESVQASTKHSPFLLDSGQQPRSPVDLEMPLSDQHNTVSASAEQFIQDMTDRIAKAKANLAAAQQRQQRNADKTRRHDTFFVGDKILVSAKAINPPGIDKVGSKLRAEFYGPFEVSEVISDVTYRLKLPESIGTHDAFHISNLRPFKTGTRYQPPPPPLAIISGEEHWEAEACLAFRYYKKGRGKEHVQFLIKWKGYPDSDNTWEYEENVKALQVVKYYKRDHPEPPPAKRKLRSRI